jgi:hypothetical protein
MEIASDQAALEARSHAISLQAGRDCAEGAAAAHPVGKHPAGQGIRHHRGNPQIGALVRNDGVETGSGLLGELSLEADLACGWVAAAPLAALPLNAKIIGLFRLVGVNPRPECPDRSVNRLGRLVIPEEQSRLLQPR